jgi:hypothetical protein
MAVAVCLCWGGDAGCHALRIARRHDPNHTFLTLKAICFVRVHLIGCDIRHFCWVCEHL